MGDNREEAKVRVKRLGVMPSGTVSRSWFFSEGKSTDVRVSIYLSNKEMEELEQKPFYQELKKYLKEVEEKNLEEITAPLCLMEDIKKRVEEECERVGHTANPGREIERYMRYIESADYAMSRYIKEAMSRKLLPEKSE